MIPISFAGPPTGCHVITDVLVSGWLSLLRISGVPCGAVAWNCCCVCTNSERPTLDSYFVHTVRRGCSRSCEGTVCRTSTHVCLCEPAVTDVCLGHNQGRVVFATPVVSVHFVCCRGSPTHVAATCSDGWLYTIPMCEMGRQRDGAVDVKGEPASGRRKRQRGDTSSRFPSATALATAFGQATSAQLPPLRTRRLSTPDRGQCVRANDFRCGRGWECGTQPSRLLTCPAVPHATTRAASSPVPSTTCFAWRPACWAVRGPYRCPRMV